MKPKRDPRNWGETKEPEAERLGKKNAITMRPEPNMVGHVRVVLPMTIPRRFR